MQGYTNFLFEILEFYNYMINSSLEQKVTQMKQFKILEFGKIM